MKDSLVATDSAAEAVQADPSAEVGGTVSPKPSKSFFVVWSPTAGPPVVRHGTFRAARHAAYVMSWKFPGQEFVVLKSCWSRRVPATPKAGCDVLPDGGCGCAD